MRNDGIGGFLTSNENLGSIKDGLVQLLLTTRGARVMRPDYGTDLRISVFQPFDASLKRNLEGQIISTIKKYEPRVIVKSLTISGDEDKHELCVRLLITSKDDLLNDQMVEVIVQ